MAEPKPFWTSVPGIISGIAATITGLAVLIPLTLGAVGKHTRRDVAATQGSPTPSGSAPVTTTSTSTSGADVTDSSSPGVSAGSGTTGTSSGSSSGPTGPGSGQSSGPASLSATPASVTFGSVASGKSSQDVSVTIANTGGPATVTSIGITGPNQGAFTITGTTCGTGSTVPPGGSCKVTLRFSPPAVGSDTASLELHYSPPDQSFMSVSLSGTGSLL